MATQTINLNLSKPEYTDDADIDVINTNMDTLDRVIGGTAMGTTASTITGAIAEHNGVIGNTYMGTTAVTLTGAIKENHDNIVLTGNDLSQAKTAIASDIGIVVKGNKSTKNINAGQYVVVVDSTITGITDGAYIAKSAVIAGTVLTSSKLTAAGNGGLNALVDMIYPVGSVYMSFNSTMPAYLTNGKTWEAITAGYVLKTVTSGTGGTLSNAGNTGSTALTVDQIPSHTHVYGDFWNVSSGSGKKAVAWNDATSNKGGATVATGKGSGHTHTTGMPKNVAIYMWQRTA